MVGCPGSGKSTLARALALRLDVVHVELDALFHQPGWTPLPDEAFRERVAETVDGLAWVVDGNYGVVQPIVWARADTVVWLDLPKTLVLRRIAVRTVRRVVRRERLWNDNREPLSNLTSLDPQRSIIAYAARQHAIYQERYASAMADAANAHITWHRLATPAEVAAFLGTART